MIEVSNMTLQISLAAALCTHWSLCRRLLGKPMYKRLLLDSVLQFTIKKWKVSFLGVMNGPLKSLTARKILPLLDLLAKYKRVLSCSCSPNFCVARKLAKQFFLFLLVLAKKSQCSACSRMLAKTIRRPSFCEQFFT